jgi:hypothetical protein
MTIAPTTFWFPTGSSQPPIISGQFVTTSGTNMMLGANRFVGIGVNCTIWSIARTTAANLTSQVKNLAVAGVRYVRINDDDGLLTENLFNSGNVPQTSTLQLDPLMMNQLCLFVSICRANDIRVLPTLHELRQCVPSDMPAGIGPEWNELMTLRSGIGTSPLGTLPPLHWVSAPLQAMMLATDTQIMSYPDPYNGNKPLGQNEAILGFTLSNEVSLVKYGPYGNPVFSSLALAAEQAWAAVNHIPWTGPYTLNKAKIAQCLATIESTVLAARVANARKLTPALILASTFFGDSPYSTLVSQEVGDAYDCHVYSYDSTSETNRFLVVPPGAQRTPFAAILGGCSWPGKPLCCTEFGFVNQAGNALDPPAEQAVEMAAAIDTMREQDVQLGSCYAWGEGPMQDDAFTKTGVYDIRVNALLCGQMLAAIERFNDLTQRPTTSVNVSPTNGVYGALVGSPLEYSIYGPTNDPALLNVPAGQKIVMVIP